MSIDQIRQLNMNDHFFALLLQCFLSGYGRPCHIRTALMSLPILMYSESRKKLVKANVTSRLETIFSSMQEIYGSQLSGRERFAGFKERYDLLLPYGKRALIILCSEKKTILDRKEIILLKNKDFKLYKGEVREWLRCAYYLGRICSKSSYDHLAYYLGVE